MNERIKEFSEQAKKYALHAMIKIPDKEQALKVYSETYDEQFTKLIVLETLSEMVIQISKFDDEQSCNPTWYKAEETVKQHFGVEE